MKTSCKCPACQMLATLAISLAVEGFLDEAEIVAREVTWIDSDDMNEGYTDTWKRPTEPDSVDLN